MIDKRRARLRPDERAAGRTSARRPVRPDDGRVLPRRGPGRAALHRQHLPLRAGGLRGVGAPRPHAERRRLPADARDRDGPAPGADHVDARRARSRRCRRSTCPPTTSPTRAGEHVRPPRRVHRRSRADLGEGHLPGGRSARLELARADAAASSATSTTTTATRVQEILQRYKRPPGHHRHPRHGRALRRGQARRPAGPQDPALPLAADVRRRGVHRQPGEYVKLEDTIKGFQEILDGKHDDLPEQAFYMVGHDRATRSSEDARPTTSPSPRRPAEAAEAEAEPARSSGRRAHTIEVSLVTPDGSAFEGEAEMLVVPGAAGEIGVLARHAPLVAMLKAGSTRVHVRRGQRGARVRHRARVLQGRAGPGARARRRRRRRDEIDDARARRPARDGAGRARDGRARASRTADRWQLEQRIKHAENQLAVAAGPSTPPLHATAPISG